MKRFIFAIIIVSAFAMSLSACTADTQSNQTEVTNGVQEISVATLPDRPADINGVVKSIEGNEIVILNELKEELLTEEERDARQAERQSMTQEERQAIREAEMATVETEQLTLQIPVGVLILTGSGNADESNISAKIADIASGTYLSIWQNEQGEIEAVKIKGAN